MTWKILVSAPYMQPVIEEFVSRSGPEEKLKQFFALLD